MQKAELVLLVAATGIAIAGVFTANGSTNVSAVADIQQGVHLSCLQVVEICHHIILVNKDSPFQMNGVRQLTCV